jgi:hypothetical protein
MVIDQDLAVVPLDLRRRLKDEYGETSAAMMLIDQAVVALRGQIDQRGQCLAPIYGWGPARMPKHRLDGQKLLSVSPSIATRSASLSPGVVRMWSTADLVQGSG